MDFFSFEFFVFCLIGIFIYYVSAPRFRNIIIFMLSCFFWATQSYAVLFTMFFILVSDFFVFKIVRKKEQKTNLFLFVPSLVAFAVYFFFLKESVYASQFLLPISLGKKNIIPPGIFVMFFQTVRNLNLNICDNKNLNGFTFFNWIQLQLFFPNFYAGPVWTFQAFKSEIDKEKRFNVEYSIKGFKVLFWALLKKLVIADRLAPCFISIVNNQFEIKSYFDMLFFGFVPFFYILFLAGAYYNVGKSLCYFLNISDLRNFDLFKYVTGIGNFWSRWFLTIKQTFDEMFSSHKNGKLISYTLILLINLIVFGAGLKTFALLTVTIPIIFIDFYLQEKSYFSNLFITYSLKLFSYILLALFWSIVFSFQIPNIEITGQIHALRYFKNSDLFIFLLIFGVVALHVIKSKISVSLGKIKAYKEYEDISVVGIVFLGYFVIMFGVF